MRLDDILRNEIFERLKNWGVPESLIEHIALKYKDSSGHELYNNWKDACVTNYPHMVTWYDDIPTDWDICIGYDELRQLQDIEDTFFEDIYELSSMHPAVVVRRNDFYVYIPE